MSENVIIDLSNYRDMTGQRVAPGDYNVVVSYAEQTKASTGAIGIMVGFRITGGEFDGATIVDRLWLTEKALFRVVAFMQALGLPTPNKRLQVNLKQFIGKPLAITVEDGPPYEGRVRSDVRAYQRVASNVVTDLDDHSEVTEPGDDEDTTSDKLVDLDEVEL